MYMNFSNLYEIQIFAFFKFKHGGLSLFTSRLPPYQTVCCRKNWTPAICCSCIKVT